MPVDQHTYRIKITDNMKSFKNIQLVDKLNDSVNNMCGIGTRKTKMFLNYKVKQGDNTAYLYRELLECETNNANAKKYNNTIHFRYRESYYHRKHTQINSLIKHLIEHNPLNIRFGYQKSDVPDTKYILYFEIPNVGQISFHTDIDAYLLPQVPLYTGQWDGKVNSTLNKLEHAIMTTYEDELRIKYKDIYDELDRKAEEEREYG